MDYKFFIDPKMKKSKQLVYKYDNLPIRMVLTADQLHTNQMESFSFFIEKHKSLNLIQIRLSNAHDSSLVFICTIDDEKFQQFKIEQSLHVTFEAFVNQISEMVEKCGQRKMNGLLTINNNENQHIDTFQSMRLEFYEKGTFKNLIHISLPIMSAPLEVILFHINHTTAQIQEENRILMQKNMNFQMELTQKSEEIDCLNGVINGLKSNLNEQEKIFREKYKEQLMRLESEIKEMTNKKNYQTQEFDKQINAFKNRIETLVKENFTLSEQWKSENKQNMQLRNDNKKSINKIAELNQQLDQLNNERMCQRTSVKKNDQIVLDLRQQLKDLEQKMMKCDKENQELMAEVQAEKNICQIKKDALKMATEDICNANTIIRRQAAEIELLKRKVDLRTEVALKQEQVIREAGKGKENLGDLMKQIDVAIKENAEKNQETEHKLKSIRDRTNLLEDKYRDRIDDIYSKLHSISPSASSTNCNSRNSSYK